MKTTILCILLVLIGLSATSREFNPWAEIIDGKYQNTKLESFSYAVCDEKLPLGSHGSLGWCGPKRTLYSDAQKDAKEHNDLYHHQASVCTGNCPTCP